jgi:hypothetical protein
MRKKRVAKDNLQSKFLAYDNSGWLAEIWNQVLQHITEETELQPNLVALLSKACVCGGLLARIAGSNSAGNMYVCYLSVMCVVR